MRDEHQDQSEPQVDSVPGLSRGKKLLFAAVLTILVIGGAEVACRLAGLGRKIPVAQHISRWQTAPDGTKFWVLKGPGYNREGMRDRDHAVDKPPGRFRIVCLGDSVTAGHGVALDQTWPFIFESYLNQMGLPVEVFNVAVSGWSTHQEVLAYEAIARKYKPDQVFLAFCLNDVGEMYNNLAEPPNPVINWLIRNSALVRALIGAEQLQVHYVRELFTNPEAHAVKVGWQRVFAGLEALDAQVRSDGGSLSVIVLPFRFQLEPDAPPPVAQDRIVAFCRERGIPCLDLLPVLAPHGPEMFLDESHLTPAGAERAARALVTWGQTGCAMCGYDLTGVEGARCPRCGHPITPR